MRMLHYDEPNTNTKKVGELVRQRRKLLKDAVNKSDYSLRSLAKRTGHSITHIERIENGERELAKLDIIYEIAQELGIPINLIIKLYLDLSDEEERWCFCVDNKKYFDGNNTILLKKARSEKSLSQQQIADAIGCSKTHYSYCEKMQRKLNDIRALYILAKATDIPLYVLIRNELGIDNDELIKLIDL